MFPSHSYTNQCAVVGSLGCSACPAAGVKRGPNRTGHAAIGRPPPYTAPATQQAPRHLSSVAGRALLPVPALLPMPAAGNATAPGPPMVPGVQPASWRCVHAQRGCLHAQTAPLPSSSPPTRCQLARSSTTSLARGLAVVLLAALTAQLRGESGRRLREGACLGVALTQVGAPPPAWRRAWGVKPSPSATENPAPTVGGGLPAAPPQPPSGRRTFPTTCSTVTNRMKPRLMPMTKTCGRSEGRGEQRQAPAVGAVRGPAGCYSACSNAISLRDLSWCPRSSSSLG
jgi:hypothetical protein